MNWEHLEWLSILKFYQITILIDAPQFELNDSSIEVQELFIKLTGYIEKFRSTIILSIFSSK